MSYYAEDDDASYPSYGAANAEDDRDEDDDYASSETHPAAKPVHPNQGRRLTQDNEADDEEDDDDDADADEDEDELEAAANEYFNSTEDDDETGAHQAPPTAHAHNTAQGTEDDEEDDDLDLEEEADEFHDSTEDQDHTSADKNGHERGAHKTSSRVVHSESQGHNDSNSGNGPLEDVLKQIPSLRHLPPQSQAQLRDHLQGSIAALSNGSVEANSAALQDHIEGQLTDANLLPHMVAIQDSHGGINGDTKQGLTSKIASIIARYVPQNLNLNFGEHAGDHRVFDNRRHYGDKFTGPITHSTVGGRQNVNDVVNHSGPVQPLHSADHTNHTPPPPKGGKHAPVKKGSQNKVTHPPKAKPPVK